MGTNYPTSSQVIKLVVSNKVCCIKTSRWYVFPGTSIVCVCIDYRLLKILFNNKALHCTVVLTRPYGQSIFKHAMGAFSVAKGQRNKLRTVHVVIWLNAPLKLMRQLGSCPWATPYPRAHTVVSYKGVKYHWNDICHKKGNEVQDKQTRLTASGDCLHTHMHRYYIYMLAHTH